MLERYFITMASSDLEAEKSKNHHLLEILFDETKGQTKFTTPKTFCGRYTMKEGAKIRLDTRILADDQNSVRAYLTKQQNAGVEFCAHCVEYFYSDDRTK